MTESAPATPVDVDDTTFEQEVLKSDLPVLVDVWAEWCPPCKAVAPVVAQLAEELAGRLKVVKVDADKAPQVTAALRAMSIPAFYIFKDGKAVERTQGALPKAALLNFVTRHLD